MNNILVVKKEKCCGCFACKQICPVEAIDIKKYNHFRFPAIDKARCTNCGLCKQVCPLCKKPQKTRHNRTIYEGYFSDKKKHAESASGGLASALCEEIIKKGGVAYGVSYENNYKSCKYIAINSINEIGQIKGSKYFETDKNNCYKEIKKQLDCDKTVLFIGLPCDVAGLKTFIKKDYEKLFLCELICHGVTSQEIHKDYIKYMEVKYGDKITDFNTRYQSITDKKQELRILFKNGRKIKKPLHHSIYGEFFYHFDRPSCYNCAFKGDYRVADLSIGDSWCQDNKSQYGKSIAYIHSLKGEKLIQSLDGFILRTLSYSTVKNDNPAISNSLQITKISLRMKKYYQANHLKRTIIRSKNVKGKIVFILRYLFYLVK